MINHGNQDQGGYYSKQLEEAVIYKECLKNHAASMGGNALDGCGEFMPLASIDAFKCSACGCHRNFHRKEVEGQSSRQQSPHYNNNAAKKAIQKREIGHQMSLHVASPAMGGGVSTPSESIDHGDGVGEGDGFFVRPVQRKKRFRTKFSQEQKEKLIEFAEKAGWKMQKLDEDVVQQFCQEIGIKRKVLKVWMHNNKLNYVNRNLQF